MNRRCFMLSCGACVSPWAYGQTEAPEIVFDRQVSISVFPHEFLLALRGGGGRIYALHRDRTNKNAYQVSQVSAEGQTLWAKDLNRTYHYSQLCVLPDGGCLAVGIDAGRKEVVASHFDVHGAGIGSVPLGSGTPVASCITSNRLVAYYPDGTVLVQDLDSARTKYRMAAVLLPAALSEEFTPRFLMVSVEPVGQDQCVVIDHTLGRIARVNTAQRTQESAQIHDPAIQQALQRSREYLKGTSAASPAGAPPSQPAVPRVLMATCADGIGNVFCLPGPIDPSKPLLLQVNASGAVQKRFRCVLPGRSQVKDKAPFHVSYVSSRLMLGFLDGTVATYNL